jgi:hypothetical protein
MEDLGRILLRPGLVAGPVQDPGSRFWPGHRVLTGSPDWPGSSFFSNQNDIVLVKKKKKVNGFATGSWSGFTGSTRRVSQVAPDFFFPCFFFNPAQLQLRVSQVPGRVSKLCLRPQIYCSHELRHYLYLYCISLSDVLYCYFTLLSIFKWKNIGTKTILNIILYY